VNPRVIAFVLFILAAFVAVNLVSLRPGIGGRTDGKPGTELERFIGWPATYVAELRESDDPTLVRRILSRAPLYSPAAEMRRRNRYFGGSALATNVSFGALAIVLVVAFLAGRLRPLLRAGLMLVVVAGMFACYLLSQRIEVHF